MRALLATWLFQNNRVFPGRNSVWSEGCLGERSPPPPVELHLAVRNAFIELNERILQSLDRGFSVAAREAVGSPEVAILLTVVVGFGLFTGTMALLLP